MINSIKNLKLSSARRSRARAGAFHFGAESGGENRSNYFENTA